MVEIGFTPRPRPRTPEEETVIAYLTALSETVMDRHDALSREDMKGLAGMELRHASGRLDDAVRVVREELGELESSHANMLRRRRELRALHDSISALHAKVDPELREPGKDEL